MSHVPNDGVEFVSIMSRLVKLFIVSAVVGFLFMFMLPAYGQLLEYGPYAGYGLAEGVLGNDYSMAYSACITGVHSSLVASNAAITVSIVTSADEYYKAFDVDQNAKASYLGYGGDDELHIGRTQTGSSSAFEIIVKVSGETDSTTIDNVKWDDQYAALLAKNTEAARQQVRLACGDRYIRTVFNQIRLYAVLRVSNSKSSTLTEGHAKFDGHADLDIASANAFMGGDFNVKSSNQIGAIQIEVYSEGFGGARPTAAIVHIATSDGLQDIASKLSAYLANNPTQGQPVKYRLAPLPFMNSDQLSDGRIVTYLAEIKAKHSATEGRLVNIESLLRNDPRRMAFIQPAADTQLKAVRTDLNKFMDLVVTAHDVCKKANEIAACRQWGDPNSSLPPAISAVELPPVVPPRMDLFMFVVDGQPGPPWP